MLTVVCVQTGNYLGRGVEYVLRLKAEVEQHLTVPHRFVCMTDFEIPGVECRHATFRGWWEKLRIFEPGLFRGRVMFLDLDTFILDNIDHIAAYDGRMAMPHDFFRGRRGLGPAVMLFDPSWASFIYEEWAACGFPQTDPRGDQGWMENLNQGRMYRDVEILQELFPRQFYSYKAHCTSGIPPGAKVICFHGKPRPHEAPGWVREHWERSHGLVG